MFNFTMPKRGNNVQRGKPRAGNQRKPNANQRRQPKKKLLFHGPAKKHNPKAQAPAKQIENPVKVERFVKPEPITTVLATPECDLDDLDDDFPEDDFRMDVDDDMGDVSAESTNHSPIKQEKSDSAPDCSGSPKYSSPMRDLNAPLDATVRPVPALNTFDEDVELQRRSDMTHGRCSPGRRGRGRGRKRGRGGRTPRDHSRRARQDTTHTREQSRRHTRSRHENHREPHRRHSRHRRDRSRRPDHRHRSTSNSRSTSRSRSRERSGHAKRKSHRSRDRRKHTRSRRNDSSSPDDYPSRSPIRFVKREPEPEVGQSLPLIKTEPCQTFIKTEPKSDSESESDDELILPTNVKIEQCELPNQHTIKVEPGVSLAAPGRQSSSDAASEVVSDASGKDSIVCKAQTVMMDANSEESASSSEDEVIC